MYTSKCLATCPRCALATGTPSLGSELAPTSPTSPTSPTVRHNVDLNSPVHASIQHVHLCRLKAEKKPLTRTCGPRRNQSFAQVVYLNALG